MRHLERSRMVAAHADTRRRIVVGRAFRRIFLRGSAHQFGSEHGSDNRQADAVQKIAASDGSIEAELTV